MNVQVLDQPFFRHQIIWFKYIPFCLIDNLTKDLVLEEHIMSHANADMPQIRMEGKQ